MSCSEEPLLPLLKDRKAAGSCHCPAVPSSAVACEFTPLLDKQQLCWN